LTDHKFIVVIRSSGERTLDVCRQLVDEQTAAEEVYTVDMQPFKKALERCYEIALEHGQARWLLTVDADMFLLPGAANMMIRAAGQMPEHYFQLQGRIFDKITGTYRKAGPRVYRIAFLKKALALSQDSAERIRPEGYVVETMGEQGHPSRYLPDITAIHDFEQYYRDLYRKSLVHARKHQELVPRMIERCVKHMDRDDDFRVILKALWDGLLETESVTIDSRMFKHQSGEAIHDLGLQEKTGFTYTPEFAGQMQHWVRIYSTGANDHKAIHDQPRQNLSWLEKMKLLRNKKGWIRGGLHSVGSVLKKAGEKLQDY